MPDADPKRDSFAGNEAWLLLELIVAKLLDQRRGLHTRITGARLTREKFRKKVLTAAARVVLGGRQIHVHADHRYLRAW